MERKKTPPAYGESPGPMMVACHWNMLSPVGPAEQDEEDHGRVGELLVDPFHGHFLSLCTSRVRDTICVA